MKLLIDTYKNTGTLHHAYLIEGEGESVLPELLDFIQKTLKQNTKGNPDLWHASHQTFSIEDARTLRERQANKAISNSKKIFIIELQSMTVEAQNALLKVLEEPTSNTHFFFVAPTSELFLPTVRSRFFIVSHEESAEKKNTAKAFLSSPAAQRLEMVSEIVEEKEKSKAIELVDGIVRELYKRKIKNKELFRDLLKCKTYLTDRSPSLKLILEHIALTVPIL